MPDVSLYLAFAAGFISFISPCVLPVVPGYVSFISGTSVAQVKGHDVEGTVLEREKRLVLLNAVFFIGGFSVVFILFGASATWIGTFFSSKMEILMKIAGSIIILFGLMKMGLLRLFVFYKEARFQIRRKKFGLAGAAVIGAAFAFGWSPCVGPILGSILAYAGTLEKMNQGMMLLLVYSIGMGIPFLLTAVGINQFFRFFDKIKKYLGPIEFMSGIILTALGIMIFLNKLVLIPGYLSFLDMFSL